MGSQTIGNFLKNRKEPLTINNLVSLSDYTGDGLSSELKDYILNAYGVSESNVYVRDNGDGNVKVALINEYFAHVIDTLNTEALNFLEDPKRYELLTEESKNAIATKNFGIIFVYNDYGSNAVLLYEIYKKHLTLKESWDLLIQIYHSIDYGFSDYFIQEVKSVVEQLNPSKTLPKWLVESANEQGYITVYRGQEAYSTSEEEAISWTTSLKTAIYFASRYGISGKLVKGEVHIDDVWIYIDDNNESEILSDKVQSIEDLSQYDTKEMIDLLLNPVVGPMDIKGIDFMNYHLYSFDRELFFEPNGIHGYLHMKRVMNLALVLIQLRKVDQYAANLICLIAKYHDVGRIDDEDDFSHGENSWKKVKNLPELTKLDKDSMSLVKFVIETHNIGDKRALKKLKNSSIKDKDFALKLYNLFCDADNLDRVRLGDLNPNYLRLEESQKLILFANHSLHHITK